jgi:hypothetical protein
MRAYQHIVAEINKAFKNDDLDHPRIHGLFMKLVITDRELWQPLFMAYLTKGRSGASAPAVEVPDIDPFDRGGKK